MNNGKKNSIQNAEITQVELSKILGITARHVRRIADMGIIHSGPNSKYILSDCIQNYIQYKIDTERNSDDVLKDAERRKAVAEADLKEIQLETTKGKLVEIEKVIEDWQKIIGVFRTRILMVSSKVAPLLIGLRSHKKIRSIVDAELNESLNELSRVDKIK